MGKTMTKRAAATIRYLAPFVRSKLAQDQSVDLRKLLMPITAATFQEDKPRILRGIQRLTKGKLAQDASIGEVAELLDIIDAHGGGLEEDESVSKAQHNAMEAAAHGTSNLGIPKKVGKEFEKADKGKTFDEDDMAEKGNREDRVEGGTGGLHHPIHEFLKGKVSAQDLDKVHQLLAKHADDHSYADDEHEEDSEIDKESQEFFGGEGEDQDGESYEEGEGEPGEKLKKLGAETGEDEEYDLADKDAGSEPEQEQRDNMREWRRGQRKTEPATDKKRRGMDRKRAKDGGGPPPFKGRPSPGGGMDRRGSAHDRRDLVTRAEMEQGIEAAVRVVREKERDLRMGFDKAVKDAQKKERDIRDAERAVHPYVGTLNLTFDSADAVYAHALKLLNVDVRGVHPSAYPSILRTVQRTAGTMPKPRVAMDAAATQSYHERFPDAGRIKMA